jgi:hypothetical protein
MDKQLYRMDFRVGSLGEVRTIVEVWKAVVASLPSPAAVKIGRTSTPLPFDVVGVSVDKKLPPGQDVFLEFIATPDMLDRFFKDLRQKGLQFTQEFDKKARFIRCQMVPPDSQT